MIFSAFLGASIGLLSFLLLNPSYAMIGMFVGALAGAAVHVLFSILSETSMDKRSK